MAEGIGTKRGEAHFPGNRAAVFHRSSFLCSSCRLPPRTASCRSLTGSMGLNLAGPIFAQTQGRFPPVTSSSRATLSIFFSFARNGRPLKSARRWTKLPPTLKGRATYADHFEKAFASSFLYSPLVFVLFILSGYSVGSRSHERPGSLSRRAHE